MGPSRPFTERDMLHSLNGSPLFLGSLVSSGNTVAVDNSTTATTFNSAANGPGLTGTLAGKILLLQPSAAGFFLSATAPGPAVSNLLVGLQTSGAAGSTPGVLLGAGERVELLMLPTEGWLQWISNSGSATLFVWELR